jgi:hypothetical protein
MTIHIPFDLSAFDFYEPLIVAVKGDMLISPFIFALVNLALKVQYPKKALKWMMLVFIAWSYVVAFLLVNFLC